MTKYSLLMFLFLFSFSHEIKEKNIINLEVTNKFYDYYEVGEDGIIAFDSDYEIINISSIFDSADIEEKTSFITQMKDENGNIYKINCRLIYPIFSCVYIFCKIKDNLEMGKHEIMIQNYSLNYFEYKININFKDKFYINKTNIFYPFLYLKDSKDIHINEKKELYELTFKADSYYNNSLILKCDAYNLKLLDTCKINNKDLTCIIKKKI